MIVAAAEQPHDTLPMMREISVQLNPAAVARFVKAHQRVAQLRRRAVVDAQVSFAAKYGERAPLLDFDALAPSRAKPMTFGRGQRRGADRRERNGADAIDGGQARIVPVQADIVQRGDVAAGQRPQMRERMRCSHGLK